MLNVNNACIAPTAVNAAAEGMPPSLTEQTATVGNALAELAGVVETLCQFAGTAKGGGAPAVFPGGTVTDRLVWMYRTINNLHDALSAMREFMR